jgi:mRNA-degrading endonuclease RelE of RelBE toxin-antitoxin system
VKTRVRLGTQVIHFITSLAPEPKRRLRAALKGIAEGKSDTKPLEGKLSGFCRLRSGRIRVIYQEGAVGSQRQILCFYADYRASVYEVFEQLLAADVLEQFSSLPRD